MPETKIRVLDVGQCRPDHSGIRALLTRHFDVEVDQVMFVDQAIAQLGKQAYALVLVNRLIFDDGSDGGELIRQMKADDRTRDVPVMLISNYQDAQDQAVADGAVPGFGKSQLYDSESVDKLAAHLPAKAAR